MTRLKSEHGASRPDTASSTRKSHRLAMNDASYMKHDYLCLEDGGTLEVQCSPLSNGSLEGSIALQDCRVEVVAVTCKANFMSWMPYTGAKSDPFRWWVARRADGTELVGAVAKKYFPFSV